WRECVPMPIIEAASLTKTYRVFQKRDGLLGAVRGLIRREYKEVRAVDGVTFSIEPGEMVAFLGPNGAGKTTTLKMLSGIIYPTASAALGGGGVFLLGEGPDGCRRRFPVVVAQKTQLWGDRPPAASSQLPREIYSLSAAAFTRPLGELTELFAVKELTRQPVRE